jgi:glycosyltransferase involved in cell wall biosynthesis
MPQSQSAAGRLLVLIPAYNEEADLPGVIRAVREAAPEAGILVVDDCSRDATSAVARSIGAQVVRHAVNLGYGAALWTGYAWAVRSGYDRLVQLDGDGQHDPAAIPAVLARLEEGYDLVLGSRFGAGVRRYRAPWMRAIGMRLFAKIASAALGMRISDPTSGYQGLSGRLMRFHVAGNHFPQDYPDADMLILVGKAGFRVCEVPVTMFEKPSGASMHSGLKPLYYVVKMSLSILLVLSRAHGVPRKETG